MFVKEHGIFSDYPDNPHGLNQVKPRIASKSLVEHSLRGRWRFVRKDVPSGGSFQRTTQKMVGNGGKMVGNEGHEGKMGGWSN